MASIVIQDFYLENTGFVITALFFIAGLLARLSDTRWINKYKLIEYREKLPEVLVILRKKLHLIGVVFFIFILIILGSWGISISIGQTDIEIVPIWTLETRLIVCCPDYYSSIDDKGLLAFLLGVASIWLVFKASRKLLHLVGIILIILGSFAPWQEQHWGGIKNGVAFYFKEGEFWLANWGGLSTLALGIFLIWLVFLTPNFVQRSRRLVIAGIALLLIIIINNILLWVFRIIRLGFRDDPEFGLLVVLLGSLLMLSAEVRDYRTWDFTQLKVLTPYHFLFGSFLIGHMLLFIPWIQVLVYLPPNPQPGFYDEPVGSHQLPPWDSETITTVRLLDGVLSYPKCYPDRINWADTVEQRFSWLYRIGWIIFYLQIAVWLGFILIHRQYWLLFLLAGLLSSYLLRAIGSFFEILSQPFDWCYVHYELFVTNVGVFWFTLLVPVISIGLGMAAIIIQAKLPYNKSL